MMYLEARRRAAEMKETMKEEGLGMSPEAADANVTE